MASTLLLNSVVSPVAIKIDELYNHSWIGSVAGELLGRGFFVCMIPLEGVTIVVDVAATASIGIIALFFAIGQSDYLRTTFKNLRLKVKDSSKTFGLLLISLVSLRSIFDTDFWGETNCFRYLEKLEGKHYHKLNETYSASPREVAVKHLVWSYPSNCICAIVLGVLACFANLCTAGLFRKWNNFNLTKTSSLPFVVPINFIFQELSSLIQLAKPDSFSVILDSFSVILIPESKEKKSMPEAVKLDTTLLFDSQPFDEAEKLFRMPNLSSVPLTYLEGKNIFVAQKPLKYVYQSLPIALKDGTTNEGGGYFSPSPFFEGKTDKVVLLRKEALAEGKVRFEMCLGRLNEASKSIMYVQWGAERKSNEQWEWQEVCGEATTREGTKAVTKRDPQQKEAFFCEANGHFVLSDPDYQILGRAGEEGFTVNDVVDPDLSGLKIVENRLFL